MATSPNTTAIPDATRRRATPAPEAQTPTTSDEDYRDRYDELEASVCDVHAWASMVCDTINTFGDRRAILERLGRLSDPLQEATDKLKESNYGRRKKGQRRSETANA
jgi:hypothetical protein